MPKNFKDQRKSIVTVYNTDGVGEQMTLTNAREMVRHRGWTMDPKLAASWAKGSAETIKADPAPAATPPAEPAVVKDLPPLAPATNSPVMEDLTVMSKGDLLTFANDILGVKVHGRSNEKTIIAVIDSELDRRLIAFGDVDAPLPVSDKDDAATIAEKVAATIARRRRAFATFATTAGLEFGDDDTIVSLISTAIEQASVGSEGAASEDASTETANATDDGV